MYGAGTINQEDKCAYLPVDNLPWDAFCRQKGCDSVRLFLMQRSGCDEIRAASSDPGD